MKSLKPQLLSTAPFWIGFVSVLIFFCLNITGALCFFPGDLGDARFNMYLLEHGYQFLSGQISNYWDAPFMYPEPALITFSDNLLGVVPFYAIFRIAGADRLLSFTLLFIVLSLLNYVACYHFLRYLFRNSGAAVLGALVFVMSIALQSQLAHAQTFARFPMPLVFLFAMQFVSEQKPRKFFLMLLFLIWQFYCGFYLGFLLSAALAIVLFWAVVLKWKSFREYFSSSRWWLRMAVSALCALLLLAPIILPYYDRADHTGYHEYAQVVISVPEIISRFFSWHGSFFWDFLSSVNHDHPYHWNDRIFPGGIAILSMLLFAFLAFRPHKYFTVGQQLPLLLISVCTLFLVFTRIGKYTLYLGLYRYVPGFASMKLLQRIINVELLFYAVAVAFIASLLFKNRRHATIIFLCGVLLIVADNFVRPAYTIRTDITHARKREQSIIGRFDTTSSKNILSYEPNTMAEPAHWYQLDAMLAAQSLGKPTINGYSGTSPKEYTPFWHKPDSLNRIRWLKSFGLNSLDVQVLK